MKNSEDFVSFAVMEEKKSTDVEWELDDIITLLPKAPKLSDVGDDKRSLDLILEARQVAIDHWALIDSDWKVLK